jgi:excinuclease ABC subunit B
VSLVCLLDADKEGFLRSETSLIQTVGRAARHVNGEAVLFADTVTDSIQSLLGITEYRRRVQHEHNEAHGIIPRTVSRSDQGSLRIYQRGKEVESALVAESGKDVDTLAVIRELEEEMQEAASRLEFERAALIRDQINQLKEEAGEKPLVVKRKRVKY